MAAKNARKIRGAIRVGGRLYREGDEDELNAVLPPAEAERLSADEGPLSGRWTGNEALMAAEPEPEEADEGITLPRRGRPRRMPAEGEMGGDAA